MKLALDDYLPLKSVFAATASLLTVPVSTIHKIMETRQRNIALVCASPAHSSSMSLFPTSDPVLFPLYPRLDVYDNRGIETQIWTNICDKFSSTGRWHAIPARRIDIHRELRGRIHSFAVSIIPIRCGAFEFTARARAPKSGNPDWVWGSSYDKNETLHVIRTDSQRTGLTQGSVRQLAQWFDDVLTSWLVEGMTPTKPESVCNHRRNVVAAYTAVFLAVIALQEGEKVAASLGDKV